MPASNTEIQPSPSKLNENLIDEGFEVFDKYEIKDTPKELIDFCEEIKDAGGRAFLVGGVVRDNVINTEHNVNLSSKDFDIEVFGLDSRELRQMLIEKFGVAIEAGDGFPVYKVPFEGLEEPIDFSVARIETKTGGGHKGFDVEASPEITLRDGGLRRDLSMNALAYDPITKEVFDGFGGIEDIKNREINVTDEETFKQDPLRVLRVAQFAARFKYKVSEDTTRICAQMVESDMLQPISKKDEDYTEEKEGVTRERISMEFEKLFLKGETPSIGIEFMDKIGYLDKYFVFEEQGKQVRFTQLKEALQDEGWHPEGNTWVHTLQTIDAAAEVLKMVGADTRVEEIEDIDFEDVPLFVSRKQLEELVQSAKASIETKVNSIRREFVEQLIKTSFPEEFEEEKGRHEEKINTEFNLRLSERMGQVLASMPTGAKISQKKMNSLKGTIFEDVRQDMLPAWERFLASKFERLDLDSEAIAQLEEKVAKKKEFLLHKKIGLDRKVLERDMKLAVMFGITFHDVGKILTTEFKDGKFRAHGHSEAGVSPAEQMLSLFNESVVSKRTKSLVSELVRYHMDPWDLESGKFSQKNFAKRGRIFRDLGGNLVILGMVAEADKRGRRPKEQGSTPLRREEISDVSFEKMYQLLVETDELIYNEGEKRQAFLSGKEVMDILKIKPGPKIGAILKALEYLEIEEIIQDKSQAIETITKINRQLTEYVEEQKGEGGITDSWVRLGRKDTFEDILSI